MLQTKNSYSNISFYYIQSNICIAPIFIAAHTLSTNTQYTAYYQHITHTYK